MRVAVYYNNKDIRIEERPIPRIGPNEILVKIIASGICGSDVMEWYRIETAPRVLGHEVAGEIVEAGAEAKGFRVGDRVFVSHHVPCNECRYCRRGYHTACATLRSTNYDPGGFAEFVRVPEINVRSGTFILPDGVTFDEGTFIEPLGCVVRGQRVAGIEPEHSVLVLGSGIAGLMHIHLAKIMGVNKVFATDISDYRMKAASEFGADVVINADDNVTDVLKDANGGRLADVVIVCTGAMPAFKQAFQTVDCGGTILMFAPTAPDVMVPLPLYDVYFRSAKIVFSYAAVNEDITEAIALLRKKVFNAPGMVTHSFGLQDIQKGFDLVARADRSIKVIIKPQD
ncbi:MAG: alcohol dehydrogenase catalytic domain-containing protein [candidate division WOR-3 bacterium]|nr:MAG: alcohol dehydrogenase catalytic domain-containing protein [candidate division WOR-3 bacterium]